MTHITGTDGRDHELTLPEEVAAIEQRHPGWRVWWSDKTKPWATRRPDASGQEATVGASYIGLLDHEIAEFEHQQRFDARFSALMAGAVA